MTKNTDDIRIRSLWPLMAPIVLMQEFPLSASASEIVAGGREAATNIIQGKDDRLLIIVGPCSIHDVAAAQEYGALLAKAATQFQNELCIIMRVYFEKPRTTVGWKGLINDPMLDGSFDINHGLRVARKLLLDLVKLGLPCGTEFLDTTIPQYLSDLISWGAIGARTTESQIHRELASGLSMPVGFKNGTDGNIQIAIDAVNAARHPHHFLGITKHGVPSIVSTTGNNACHVILRGATAHTNYDAESIAKASQQLGQAHLTPRVMVDCSHGNSAKDYTRQKMVAHDIAQQLQAGSTAIAGIMLESNLVAGKQAQSSDKPLVYGQSITDACIAWSDTVAIFEDLATAIKRRRKET